MTEPRQDGRERPLFRVRHRLTRATEFRQAYCRGRRASAGPITVFVCPNGLGDHRLGLSVGRRVGGAVMRNRVKRLLREAFRLSRADLPSPSDGCYDIVVNVRPHKTLPLVAYQGLLGQVVHRAHEDLTRGGAGRESADAAP